MTCLLSNSVLLCFEKKNYSKPLFFCNLELWWVKLTKSLFWLADISGLRPFSTLTHLHTCPIYFFFCKFIECLVFLWPQYAYTKLTKYFLLFVPTQAGLNSTQIREEENQKIFSARLQSDYLEEISRITGVENGKKPSKQELVIAAKVCQEDHCGDQQLW